MQQGYTKGPWHKETPAHQLLKCTSMFMRLQSVGGHFPAMQPCPDIQVWANGNNSSGGFFKPIALLPMAEDDPEDEANARLIAAAPELFEMLKLARNCIDRDETTFKDECAQIDAVIAKATNAK